MNAMKIFILLIQIVMLTSCTTGPSPAEQRAAMEAARWKEADARQVAEELIRDLSIRPLIDQFMNTHDGSKPKVTIEPIRDLSGGAVDAATLDRQLAREIQGAGRMQIVTEAADHLLRGTITVSDGGLVDGNLSLLYRVELELIAIATNAPVWKNEKEIRKVAVPKKR